MASLTTPNTTGCLSPVSFGRYYLKSKSFPKRQNLPIPNAPISGQGNEAFFIAVHHIPLLECASILFGKEEQRNGTPGVVTSNDAVFAAKCSDTHDHPGVRRVHRNVHDQSHDGQTRRPSAPCRSAAERLLWASLCGHNRGQHC